MPFKDPHSPYLELRRRALRSAAMLSGAPRLCSRCRKWLAPTCFYKHTVAVDGLRPSCKICDRSWHLVTRRKNWARAERYKRKYQRMKKLVLPKATILTFHQIGKYFGVKNSSIYAWLSGVPYWPEGIRLHRGKMTRRGFQTWSRSLVLEFERRMTSPEVRKLIEDAKKVNTLVQIKAEAKTHNDRKGKWRKLRKEAAKAREPFFASPCTQVPFDLLPVLPPPCAPRAIWRGLLPPIPIP